LLVTTSRFVFSPWSRHGEEGKVSTPALPLHTSGQSPRRNVYEYHVYIE
jgi:hypothetical protein